MDHQDHVALIRGATDGAGPRWLELGAGTGAFTLALLDLLSNAADVTALDRDARALRALAQEAGRRFPSASVHILEADFTRPLPVEPASFDGVLMANSLHFVKRKEPVLRAAIDALRPDGRFVLVEYGSDRGNPWVPWPISLATWIALAESVGLEDTRRIGEVPSRFLGSIYAAASVRPAGDGRAAADAAETPTPRSQ
jgi:SAM-dependent methyltransferase